MFNWNYLDVGTYLGELLKSWYIFKKSGKTAVPIHENCGYDGTCFQITADTMIPILKKYMIHKQKSSYLLIVFLQLIFFFFIC